MNGRHSIFKMVAILWPTFIAIAPSLLIAHGWHGHDHGVHINDVLGKEVMERVDIVEVSPDPVLDLRDADLPLGVTRVNNNPQNLAAFEGYYEYMLYYDVQFDTLVTALISLFLDVGNDFDDLDDLLEFLRDIPTVAHWGDTGATRSDYENAIFAATAKLWAILKRYDVETKNLKNKSSDGAKAMEIALALARSQA